MGTRKVVTTSQIPELRSDAVRLALVLARVTDPAAGRWQERALCAQVDPDAWFPGKGESPRLAKQTCAACPVREQCLDYAIEHGETFGIWGGMTERERRRVARDRRAA